MRNGHRRISLTRRDNGYRLCFAELEVAGSTPTPAPVAVFLRCRNGRDADVHSHILEELLNAECSKQFRTVTKYFVPHDSEVV